MPSWSTSALFFLLPLWIMVVTSLKPMEEIRLGNILALPAAMTFDAWIKAWSSACTGLECNGISVGFWNSVRILIPSVILSIIAGAVNGYALSFWRVKGANVMFGILLLGAFIPYQVFLYPLVRIFSLTGVYNSLLCIVLVHVIFGLPTMTLLFRNYYAGLPHRAVQGGAHRRRRVLVDLLPRHPAHVDAHASWSRRSCRSPASGTTSSSG